MILAIASFLSAKFANGSIIGVPIEYLLSTWALIIASVGGRMTVATWFLTHVSCFEDRRQKCANTKSFSNVMTPSLKFKWTSCLIMKSNSKICPYVNFFITLNFVGIFNPCTLMSNTVVPTWYPSECHLLWTCSLFQHHSFFIVPLHDTAICSVTQLFVALLSINALIVLLPYFTTIQFSWSLDCFVLSSTLPNFGLILFEDASAYPYAFGF